MEGRVIVNDLRIDKAGTMVFIDSGDSFDPTQIPDDYDPGNVLKSKQTRGYGLTMLRRLSDRMRYIRKAGILNILIIDKSWRQIDE